MRIGEDSMIVNGEIVEIDPGRGTSPMIIDGRALLPIRAAIEAMGGDVGWDAAEHKVTINAFDHIVEMRIGDMEMIVDGKTTVMDVAPVIINSRTMLPIRYATENIGCLVEWVEDTEEIIVTYPS
jgi:hypothetical protein